MKHAVGWGLGLGLTAALFGGMGTAKGEAKPSDPLQISLYGIVHYTDNRDAWPENEESTWDFYGRLRAGISYPGEPLWIDGYYAPSYRYRTNPSEVQNETELHHDVGLHVRHHPTPRMEVRFLEKFDYTDDPKIEEGNRVIRGDQTYYLSRTELGLIHAVTRRSTVDVFGRYLTKQYSEDAAAKTSDEERIEGGLTLHGHVTPQMGVLAMAQYSTYEFASPYGINRDFASALGGGGVEYIYNPNLRVGAKAGVQSVQYEDENLSSQVAMFGELWAKGWTVPSLHLMASLGHGIREADAYPFASQEYTEGRMGVEWQAGPRWILGLSGVYRISDYDRKMLPSGVEAAWARDPALREFLRAATSRGSQEGSEATTEIEAGVTFKLTETSSARLVQRYERVDSDVGDDYTKNATTLTISKQF